MNRKHRRALGRARITRHPARQHSYKLVPQICALWVPELKGYVSAFCPHTVQVVEFAELAHHYDEDEAASAALAFREVTGLRVAVRPVYLQAAA